MARRRLGEVLTERQVISPAQLEEALAIQRRTKERLGAILVARGFLSERLLVEALATATGMAVVDLDHLQPDWAAVHALRAAFCEEQLLFPYALQQSRNRRQLAVAVTDPLNIPALEQIQRTTGMQPLPQLASLSAVRRAIDRFYYKREPTPASPGATEAELEEVLVLDEGEAGEALELTSHLRAPAPPSRREPDVLFNPPPVASPERELRALVRLMMKKHFITRAELDAELARDPSVKKKP